MDTTCFQNAAEVGAVWVQLCWWGAGTAPSPAAVMGVK